MVGMYIGGFYYSYTMKPPTISIGQWSFVAVTLNGTTLTFYVNNVSNSLTTAGTPNASAGTIYIGDFGNAGYHFNGSIDDVRIYNRALSAAEIKAIYDATK